MCLSCAIFYDAWQFQALPITTTYKMQILAHENEVVLT